MLLVWPPPTPMRRVRVQPENRCRSKNALLMAVAAVVVMMGGPPGKLSMCSWPWNKHRKGGHSPNKQTIDDKGGLGRSVNQTNELIRSLYVSTEQSCLCVCCLRAGFRHRTYVPVIAMLKLAQHQSIEQQWFRTNTIHLEEAGENGMLRTRRMQHRHAALPIMATCSYNR